MGGEMTIEDLKKWGAAQGLSGQNGQNYAGSPQQPQHVCPNCGYCPCCGRRDQYAQPWPSYPYPYIGDGIPWTTTISLGSTGSAGLGAASIQPEYWS